MTFDKMVIYLNVLNTAPKPWATFDGRYILLIIRHGSRETLEKRKGGLRVLPQWDI